MKSRRGPVADLVSKILLFRMQFYSQQPRSTAIMYEADAKVLPQLSLW